MANSIIEQQIEIPAAHERNIYGQFDEHIKKIERTLRVTLISRDGVLKIVGPEPNVKKAAGILKELLGLSLRGNTIQAQNVDYALSLTLEEKDAPLVEMDKECICHTINGRPVKPKTLGQKQYVDQIRKEMIVFGVGPAGTGKTYLAMA
ncbi:MAG: PhoH family protein, partial [Oliverpabstia sp.]